ncbi:MAG: ABC transporter substrate-binding protein [Oscillospiraceae bacterium]|nr:ABC transporter substrate-binding protein [Oscillospiraceae bacterium]
MKRLMTLLCVMALCLSLAGCYDTETPEEGTDFWEYAPVEPTVSEDVPTTAQVFTLPYLSSQTLDPVACPDGVQQAVGSLLYEGLFVLDEQFSPQPLLCSSYTLKGLTYTFQLRDGVTFSNGASFTSSDVLSTYRRAQISDRYAARFANVVSMRAGRGTLTITLRQADSAFPALLDIPIVKSGTEKDPVPLGTGPYLFLTDSDGPCLVRSENWWNDLALIPERIELAAAKDADTAAYLFSARSAHLLTADLLSETTAASLGSVDMTDAPTTTMLFLGFNTDNPALADPALRVAMGSAFDRDAIAAALLAGHAEPAQFPISPSCALYPTALEAPFDAGAYEDALAPAQTESVPPQPLELTLLVNAENSFKTAVAEYLAKALSAAYVTVTTAALPWNEYLAALEGGDFDLWLGEVRLTADWDISALVTAGGALNYGKFTNTDVDTALRAFLNDETPAAAEALCAQLAAQAPILPVVFKSLTVLTPEGLIDGVSPTATHPLRSLDQWVFHFSA